MATHQPEMQVDIEEAVREMLAVEVEAEEQDPFEGMGNAQVAEIYHRMKPEDQGLFRQFKRFHKQYYETHGHDAPSHQLTRGIIQQMFPRLPSADADTIAKARAELLATERLKELCKQLGLAVLTQPQEYPPPPEVDPMQDFEDDNPTQTVIIDHDTDASSDVDDLSEVSMASAGGIEKQEFQGLLSDIAAQHQRMAASLDTLASRVEDMSVEKVEEVAVRVASETGHVRGLEEITGVLYGAWKKSPESSTKVKWR